jgi:hypothetical protein
MNQAEIRDEMAAVFRDMYKDAHGIRPRFDTSSWTIADFEKEFEFLQNTIEHNYKIEKEAEQVSIKDFERFVSASMSKNGIDRITALRWIIDGEYDIGYVEFQYGLPYGYIEKEFKA